MSNRNNQQKKLNTNYVTNNQSKKQIDIYEIDDTHNFKCVGTRKMDFKETLEFIIDKLFELMGEL